MLFFYFSMIKKSFKLHCHLYQGAIKIVVLLLFSHHTDSKFSAAEICRVLSMLYSLLIQTKSNFMFLQWTYYTNIAAYYLHIYESHSYRISGVQNSWKNVPKQ